jgi:inosine-uridine nucleoside N-ribohydrolase
MLGLFCLVSGTTISKIPLIIDTDTALTVPGLHDIDDDLAVLFALAHLTKVRLLGVTTTFGNADGNETFKDALNLALDAGFDVASVAHGGSYKNHSVHTRTVASSRIIQLVSSSPDPVTIVCIGAHDYLTRQITDRSVLCSTGAMSNLAAATVQDPSIVGNIDHIIMMGGSTGEGPPLVQVAHIRESGFLLYGLNFA